MSKPIKIRKFSRWRWLFSEYWLTDTEVFDVGIISLWLYAITVLAFAAIIFLLTGAIGGVVPTAVAAVSAYLIMAALASRRRGAISDLPAQDLEKLGSVVRVPWPSIRTIELRGTRLSIFSERKVYRAWLKKSDVPLVVDYLQKKLPDKFSVR